MFFILGVAHAHPLFKQAGLKSSNFLRFYQSIFRITALQHKLLALIESFNTFYWESPNKQSDFGHRNKIWTKLGPMLWQKQRNWHYQ